MMVDEKLGNLRYETLTHMHTPTVVLERTQETVIDAKQRIDNFYFQRNNGPIIMPHLKWPMFHSQG